MAPTSGTEGSAEATAEVTAAATDASRVLDAARLVAATGLIGSAIIHFAYAPGHLDSETSHGVFFLVVGWLQLALGVALVLRARPERTWLAASVVLNLGVVAVWVVSRTAGVPGSEKEAVGFPDVTATALEIAAVLAALVVLAGAFADRPLSDRPAFGLVGIGAVATVALVSMAVSPSFAGDHGPGGHSHGEDAAADADGHDHAAMGADTGADAAAHATGADPDAWAETRLLALAGYASDAQVEQFKQLEAAYLSEQIRTRSDYLRELSPAEAEERIATYVDWAVENTIALLEGAQSGGEGGEEGMHTHGPVQWQPIDDPADQLLLQQQLEASGQVIEQFPTVADAEAGGYHQISPYVPGIGAHWINGDLDNAFDPGAPEMLLYNGTEPTSRIIGLSYAAIGDEPPEGFVGPNDVWHAHPALCLLGGFVVGIDGTPEDLCESIGGRIASSLADLHMAHLWQVPGWESSWGIFSAENPQINVATSDLGRSLVTGG